jgi:hypothetical protein
MPLHYNLQIEIFDVWDIDFIEPFQKSQDCEYILVAIDYVSKWVEALPCRAADARHARKMFREQYIQSIPERVRSQAQYCHSIPSPDQWPSRDLE